LHLGECVIVGTGALSWIQVKMSVFKLKVVSLPNGDFAPTWFDDEQFTWDDKRLRLAEPLVATWQTPRLQLLRPRPTPVLFNPVALAVSEDVRAALADFSEIEFLAVEIAGFSTFFIMHVVAAVTAPEGCSLRYSPGGNIVELFSVPPSYTPEVDFFRVALRNDLPAGSACACMPAIYASARGAQSVVATCRGYLRAVNMVDDCDLH
jgi:hypothetical protein